MGKTETKTDCRPVVFPLRRQFVHLQKALVGAALHFDQVRDLDRCWDLGKIETAANGAVLVRHASLLRLVGREAGMLRECHPSLGVPRLYADARFLFGSPRFGRKTLALPSSTHCSKNRALLSRVRLSALEEFDCRERNFRLIRQTTCGRGHPASKPGFGAECFAQDHVQKSARRGRTKSLPETMAQTLAGTELPHERHKPDCALD